MSDDRLSLADLLNRVLDRGVVVTGDAMISVAGIDLVRLSLQLVLTSIEADRSGSAAALPRTGADGSDDVDGVDGSDGADGSDDVDDADAVADAHDVDRANGVAAARRDDRQ